MGNLSVATSTKRRDRQRERERGLLPPCIYQLLSFSAKSGAFGGLPPTHAKIFYWIDLVEEITAPRSRCVQMAMSCQEDSISQLSSYPITLLTISYPYCIEACLQSSTLLPSCVWCMCLFTCHYLSPCSLPVLSLSPSPPVLPLPLFATS